MVAAAFIGPGTVTTATLAGATYGYTLIWAVVFSVLATMVLQEMAARLGVVSRMGLGEALLAKAKRPLLKSLAIILVLVAILVGNAAYEAGNLAGAALGFEHWRIDRGGFSFNPAVLLVAVLAALILYRGSFRTITNALGLLVVTMGIVFLLSAMLVTPSIAEIMQALFKPTVPQNSMILVMGLIGTTVVPYNLFLHSSSAKIRWSSPEDLKEARLDTLLSVGLGGLITIAILVCATAALFRMDFQVESAAGLAQGLKPLLGEWSTLFLSFGFLAAGLSSAITAPLAAAFATTEMLQWDTKMTTSRFRMIWFLVLLAGVLCTFFQIKPTEIILLAQTANGILLPILAIFLLWIMNDIEIMGTHINDRWPNIFGVVVVVVALALGLKSLVQVFA